MSTMRKLGVLGTVVLVLVLAGCSTARTISGARTTTTAGGSASTSSPASTQTDEVIQRAVLQAEQSYFLAPGQWTPVVSYVVTSPSRAYDYLARVDWSNAFYSDLDCHCTRLNTQPERESGTTEAELSLIPVERGPVALVEVSGVMLDSLSVPIGGPACLPKTPCWTLALRAYQAPVAFLVVNLNDGKTTGGMIATPQDGGSTFSLDSLGTVTSWHGPRAFGQPPRFGHFKVVLVDTPHMTGQ